MMNDCTSTAWYIFSVINFSLYMFFLTVLLCTFLIVFIISVVRNLPKKEKTEKKSHVENHPREGEGTDEEEESNDKLVRRESNEKTSLTT